MLRRASVLAFLIALVALPVEVADAAKRKRPVLRDVLYVGNNWDGTADVIQPRRFGRLARLNIIPDIAERMAEIQADPARMGYFLGIREEVGEATTSSWTTCSPPTTAGSCTCRGRASRT